MISPISGYTAKSVGLAIFLLGESLFAQVAVPPQDAHTHSTIAAHTVFEETGGVLAVEAEHFHRQTETSPRAFYVISDQRGVAVRPDADQPHISGASGGAYVECLPDERVTHGDPLVPGRNFSNEGGGMATLRYRVKINTPGRYYVWCRVFSTGTEDNGIHVGLDGTWPSSGQRWQTTQKNAWSWDNRQRTEANHEGEPFGLYLDFGAEEYGRPNDIYCG